MDLKQNFKIDFHSERFSDFTNNCSHYQLSLQFFRGSFYHSHNDVIYKTNFQDLSKSTREVNLLSTIPPEYQQLPSIPPFVEEGSELEDHFYDHKDKSIYEDPSIAITRSLESRSVIFFRKKFNKYIMYGKGDKIFFHDHNDANEYKHIDIYEGYENNDIDVTSDGRFLYGVAQSYYVYVQDLESLVVVFSYKLGSYGNSVCLSPDEKYFACCTDSKGYFLFSNNVSIGEFKLLYNGEAFLGACDYINFNCKSNKLVCCNRKKLIILDMFDNYKQSFIELEERCGICNWHPTNENVFVFATSKALFIGNVNLDVYLIKKYSTSTQGLCYNYNGSKMFVSSYGNNLDEFDIPFDISYDYISKDFKKKIRENKRYVDMKVITLLC